MRPRLLQACLLLALVAQGWVAGGTSPPDPSPMLTPHAPILILGNGDFTPANGVTGGSGLPGDPYVIEGWEIDATASNGIEIQATDAHFVIRDVFVHSAPSTLNYAGVLLDKVANGRLENLTLEDTLYGIWGVNIETLTIARSRVSRMGYDGIFLDNAANVSFLDNLVQEAGVLNTIPAWFVWEGISLQFSRNVTAVGNTLRDNDHFGLGLYNSTAALVIDNTFEGNWGGTSLWGVSDARVAGNVVANQSGYGLDFLGVKNVTVEDDRVSNTLIGVLFSGVLGDPELQNENVTVRRNVISGSWIGMVFSGVVAPVVSENFLLGSLNPAMAIESTEDGVFTANVIEGSQWDGLTLYFANRTTLVRNNITGIVNLGVHSLYSQDVTMVENRIAGNGVGVALEGSGGWLVHHNLFEGNGIQAQDDLGAANAWDDGYPSGGNWWSDYGGVDMCSGPLQNICPNPDSIGDTPYVIDPDTRDRYPLWTPAAIPPVASFDVAPPVGNITTGFAFDASGTWDANEPAANLAVQWDWEDDGTWDTPASTNKSSVHTYAAVGLYTVRLQVRDSSNLTNETTREVLVENTPPVALFDVVPTTGNVTTIFTANASSSSDLEDPAAALEVRWDWEGDLVWDTGWSSSKVAGHQFTAAGIYTIRLQVKDSGGFTAEAARNVEVYNTPPQAAFVLVPPSGNVTTIFTADASASSDLEDPLAALEVRWDWEDDAVWDTPWSTTKAATHAFPAPGAFTVRLEVRDTGGLVDSATRTADVQNTPPSASLSSNPLLGGLATSFAFDASSSTDLEDPPGALQVRWDWEDDGVWDTGWSAGMTASRVYGVVGLHTARVEVRDTGGLSDTAAATVEVRPGPVTSLEVGAPNVTAGGLYISPTTPLSLSVDDRGGAGILRTQYRIDGGPWVDYGVTGPFTLPGDGPRTVEWYSEDVLGNVEPVQAADIVVDGSPPAQSFVVGTPSHTAGETWITSSTPITLTTGDLGNPPVGLANAELRTWNGSWSPWTPNSAPITLSGEGRHYIEYRATDLLGNVAAPGNASYLVDDAPPTSVLVAGSPQVQGTRLSVTSGTPLSLVAADPGPTPVGVATVEYRVWLGAWTPWTPYAGPFFLLGGDGEAYVDVRTSDLLGNTVTEQNTTLLVDDVPPTTDLALGDPKYVSGNTYVTSSTPFTLTATDGGAEPVGLAGMEYRVDGGPWLPYTASFTVAGDGPHLVGYRATDLLGNVEPERSVSVLIDDSPPQTLLSPSAGPFNESTEFTLAATDPGSGVARTEMSLDGSAWTNYTAAFRLPLGDHTVRFRSVDALGNRESDVVMAVDVTAPELPPAPGLNYKPYLAAVFAVVLLITGYWLLVLRRRESEPAERRRVFLLHAAPWATLEAATGILSAATGLLAIPPLLGPGTAVDGVILLAGLIWIWRRSRRSPDP